MSYALYVTNLALRLHQTNKIYLLTKKNTSLCSAIQNSELCCVFVFFSSHRVECCQLSSTAKS